MKLRQYQKDACSAIWQAFFEKNKTSGLIVLPTGAGKTVTALSFIKQSIKDEKLHKILWLTHRIELANQAFNAAKKLIPETNITAWNAKVKDATGDLVIGMVQSCKKLAESCDTFDLIIVDEAHHVSVDTNTYNKVIDALNYKYSLGITATPERRDKKAINYKKIFFQISFLELVKLGYLAKPNYIEMLTRDYYQLDYRNGEFTTPTLEKLNNETRNTKIVQEWVKNRQKYGQTLVFAVNIKHCHDLAHCFSTHAPDACIRVVTSDTPSFDRRMLIQEMAQNKVDIIINCAVYLEGFDAPSVNTIILARPTASESMFCQMVGRGARIIVKNGKVIKDTFNILSVMDDITKYATLVREWEGNIIDITKTERYRKEKELKEAQASYTQACTAVGVDPPALKDANVLDVEGILSFSTKFKKNVGLPITQERGDCLRRLRVYAKECYINNRFDMQKFALSYPSCVLYGELPRKMWKDIAYAWAAKFVYKQDMTNGHKTWTFVKMKDIDQQAAQKRLERDRADAGKANKKFNETYQKNENKHNLITKLYDIASRKGTTNRRFVLNKIRQATKHIEMKNRSITIQTNLIIDGYKSKVIAWISRSGDWLTEALQDVLNDSCAQVVVKSLRK